MELKVQFIEFFRFLKNVIINPHCFCLFVCFLTDGPRS